MAEWNFASGELGATITASAVASDGQEATNLLQAPPFFPITCTTASSPSCTTVTTTATTSSLAPAFVCANFVRTPVEIVLTFPHEVNVSCVVVRPKVRSQVVQALALEVAAAADEMQWRYLGTYGDLHTKLSSFDQEREEAVLFYNPGFRSREYGWSLPASRSPNLADPSRIRIDRTAYALAKVKKLKVVLKKMLQSGYVCLAGLEVWGQPAGSCSQEVLTQIQTKLASWKPPVAQVVLPQRRTPQEQTMDPQWLEKLRRIPTDAFPQHFMDPITFEVMQDPVLLPSGKVVDRNTIERHLRNHLTDPFSGLPLRHEDITNDRSLHFEIYRFVITYKLPPVRESRALSYLSQLHQLHYGNGVPAVDPQAAALGAELARKRALRKRPPPTFDTPDADSDQRTQAEGESLGEMRSADQVGRATKRSRSQATPVGMGSSLSPSTASTQRQGRSRAERSRGEQAKPAVVITIDSDEDDNDGETDKLQDLEEKGAEDCTIVLSDNDALGVLYHQE